MKTLPKKLKILETTIQKFKKDIRIILIKIKNAFDDIEWYDEKNFTMTAKTLHDL